MSNEINTFLSKQPLKMAASTLYSIQKLNEKKLADEILSEHPHIAELMDRDVSFLEGYYSESIDLIPERYRELTKILLEESAPEMEKTEQFENFEI